MSLLLSIIAVWLAASELPGEATLPGTRTRPRELPSESSLPGRPRSATPPVETRLPAESVLPAGFIAEMPKTPAEIIAEVVPESEPLVDASPSDVPQVPARPVTASKVPPPIGQAPPGLPWLRLNMRGHVGNVRSLAFTADGARLLSAGDDKTVEVWTRLGVDGNRRWSHERAIRWPVQRGPRGRLYSIAAAPGVLAMAGLGSLGGLGEIWLVDPVTGELKRALIDEQIGHRQVVAGLAFPPQRGDVLASQDLTGRVLAWRQDPATGLWKAKQLVAPDFEALPPEEVRLLQASRRFAPVVMPNDRQVVVATLAGWKTSATRPDKIPAWSVERIDIESGERAVLQAETPHLGSVMALAVTRDGRTLASSDTFGSLHLWNMANRSLVAIRRQNIGLSALAWTPDGQTLLTGSTVSQQRNGKAAWQTWRVSNPRSPELVAEEAVDRDILALAVNSTGDEFAYSQGSELVLRRIGVAEVTDRLRGLSRPVLRVAFAAQPPEYRIAIGTRRAADGAVPWERAFDLSALTLDAGVSQRDGEWLDDASWSGGWSIQTERDATGELHWLYQGDQRAARLPLHPTLHGRPSARCWIPDREGRPLAVAIGTSLQGNIFVFQLAATGTASVLRQFRGHEGGVRAISVSRDRRYLCSGADDATVRVWNLDGFEGGDEWINRWGAQFEVREDKLIASNVREDGPLYFRGVRTDDAIHALAWPVGRDVQNADRPGEMLQQLQTSTWDTQVAFDCRRRNTQLDGFQMLPAWQPLAALFVADNREWACWTPAGYYDASFDGHKLFGWQINRGVDLLPEFFLAAQFRQALERPAVLNKLLGTGSLPAALRAAPDLPPGDGQDAVLPQYRLKPRIEIVAPRPDEQLAEQRVTIRAKVVIRDGLELVPPKAFANGVVAPERQLLQETATPGGKEFLYEWNAAVPADAKILIQVVASSDAEAAEYQTVSVRGMRGAAPRSQRIFVLAAGVNDYRDAQIQRLDFAANNARRLVETFQQTTPSTDSALMLDDHATRPLWTVITADYADRLRRVASPDDLLVFFLSGHGIRDESTDRYYFVAADARYDDLKSRQFKDCLSFTDFAAFADVPCRKLAILDTCHAGAVQQPLRQQDLKSAIRALQDDVVFTMTASEGTQEAAEEQSRQLGRFTARLIEALQGAADEASQGGDANGLVTLREASDYVRAAVAGDSARTETPQHPTVGPIDLIEFAEFPLSRR